MLRRYLFVICLGVFVCFGLGNASAQIINGDFSTDLSGWTTGGVNMTDENPPAAVITAGDVKVENGEAVLLDGSPGANIIFYSFLYQDVELDPGWYTLELDFKYAFSRDAEDGFFPDSFYASLIYTDDLSLVDLYNMAYGEDLLPLFAIEDGVASYDDGEPTGTDPNAKGIEWIHYKVRFQNSFAYVMPTFEIYGDNGSLDSEIRLDNISITKEINPIPEPKTILLLTAGLACFALMRLRHKKNITA